jgi:nucleotide-binding universal stress UspA family protein
MRLHQILVPLDTSQDAEAALPIARALAASTQAVLNLLAVSPHIAPGRTRELHAYLEAIADAEHISGGRRVRTTLRLGDPGEAILRVECDLHVDLVVMATHGRSGPRRLLLGSVAERVAQQSSVPVVLLGPGERSSECLQTLLVPIDGTRDGARALAMAVPLARACAARLVLLQASTFDSAAAQQHVDHVVARLSEVGLCAERRGVVGLPGKSIVLGADDVNADLIVMSSHGRSGPVRAVLGSVADEVVRTSGRPVMLLPRRTTWRDPVDSP